ncbi:dihydrofolate reductase family protein [Cryobacterium sp. PAMC25264]|uniref:dihydrofolate reductase family protein n=1 Tax=Cryobacterium sp. PAMC25264 TaxID=2861288 RepID=UPI001C629936|nr:dihydrofolate reductase family protein [Cryobacterium sp. PAMC25264]QYF74635.1 dihydrofolate reductase family protein [Cryobacterium sp. PAMC25264]
MGRLVVQECVTADGFAANSDGEFAASELLEGGTAEFDRSQTECLWGSLALSRAFFAAGEVDEVRLVVMPVVIGSGRGVFPDDIDPTVLDLTSAQVFDTGLVELVYLLRPAPDVVTRRRLEPRK